MKKKKGIVPAILKPALIFIYLICIILIIIAIVEPGYSRVRKGKRKHDCQKNLLMIDAAKTQWAIDTNAEDIAVPGWSDIISPGKAGYLEVQPVCPAGGSYSINTIITAPTCSKSSEGHSLPQ